jgi:hypothetical protein
VFQDGTRLCVLNLAGMQFGVQIDPALLLLIEQAPICLRPVFEVQSNGRIVLHDDDDDEEPGDGEGSGGGPGPSSPTTPPPDLFPNKIPKDQQDIRSVRSGEQYTYVVTEDGELI